MIKKRKYKNQDPSSQERLRNKTAMKHDEAYRIAERKIEEARQPGVKELDLSVGEDEKTLKLIELPGALGKPLCVNIVETPPL